ncbi:MAG: ASPIC/UnbV domain-containing protein [Acidobacteria bacterium]|nr:ASPIC/UnbV domain-containing protein [Acidobacteriota bacterium]
MSAVAHIKDYKTGKFYRDEFRGDISWNGYEHNVLLRNDTDEGDGAKSANPAALRFHDVAMATGADDIKDARGMSTADFDNDGDLDIVTNSNPGDSGRAELSRATLLRNNVGERRNWLAVELRGKESNRDAVGAVVTIEAGGGKQMRLVTAGSGFASQHTARLYFGLGEKNGADSLTVRWPRTGRVERFEKIGDQPIGARRMVRVTEGEGIELLTLPTRQPSPGGKQIAAAN